MATTQQGLPATNIEDVVTAFRFMDITPKSGKPFVPTATLEDMPNEIVGLTVEWLMIMSPAPEGFLRSMGPVNEGPHAWKTLRPWRMASPRYASALVDALVTWITKLHIVFGHPVRYYITRRSLLRLTRLKPVAGHAKLAPFVRENEYHGVGFHNAMVLNREEYLVQSLETFGKYRWFQKLSDQSQVKEGNEAYNGSLQYLAQYKYAKLRYQTQPRNMVVDVFKAFPGLRAIHFKRITTRHPNTGRGASYRFTIDPTVLSENPHIVEDRSLVKTPVEWERFFELCGVANEFGKINTLALSHVSMDLSQTDPDGRSHTEELMKSIESLSIWCTADIDGKPGCKRPRDGQLDIAAEKAAWYQLLSPGLDTVTTLELGLAFVNWAWRYNEQWDSILLLYLFGLTFPNLKTLKLSNMPFVPAELREFLARHSLSAITIENSRPVEGHYHEDGIRGTPDWKSVLEALRNHGFESANVRITHTTIDTWRQLETIVRECDLYAKFFEQWDEDGDSRPGDANFGPWILSEKTIEIYYYWGD